MVTLRYTPLVLLLAVLPLLTVAGCTPSPELPALELIPAADELTEMPPRARVLLREAQVRLAEEPARADRWIRVASILQANDQLELASDAYGAAMQLDGANPKPRYLRSHALRASGLGGEAEEMLTAVVEMAADYAPACRTRAAWALDAGELDLAMTYVQRALKLDPDDVGARATKARVEMASGSYQQVVETLSFELADNHGGAYLRFLKGRALVALGGEGQAGAPVPQPTWSDPWMEEVTALEAGIEQDLVVARSALDQGQMEVAIEILESAAEWSPGRPDTVQLLSQAYRKAGRFSDAVELLEDAAKRQPSIPEHLVQLVASRFVWAVKTDELSHLEEALPIVEHLKESWPEDYRGFALAGDVQFAIGKAELAMGEYQTCRSMRPFSRARCEVKEAKCLFVLKRYREAVVLLEETFGSSPTDREVQALLTASQREAG